MSVFALLAVTGVGVASAFADLARENALAGAYQEASLDAARAAGGNPGPDWATLLEAPAGRRSLALWFDTMQRQWPTACAAKMAEVSQSSALCLPDSGLLQALIDTRLGPESFAMLADNAAANALERAAPDPLADQNRFVGAIETDEINLEPTDAAPTETVASRAADALREEEEAAALEAFLGAYEPPATPALIVDPAEASASEPVTPPSSDTAPVAETTEAVEPPITAGPTLNPDEPIAANSSALLDAPIVTSATLALVTP